MTTDIAQLADTLQETSDFFYKYKHHSTWAAAAQYKEEIDTVRRPLDEQAGAYKRTVDTAILEAENGQIVARKIVQCLRGVQPDTPRQDLEDRLQIIQKHIMKQRDIASSFKTGLEEIQGAIAEVARDGGPLLALRQNMIARAADAEARHNGASTGHIWSIVGAVLLAPTIVGAVGLGMLASGLAHDAHVAREQRDAAQEAVGILDNLRVSITRAIDIVGKHIDFWSDLLAIIVAELEQLSCTDELIINGRVMAVVFKDSIDTWTQLERAYTDYASKARQSKLILG